MVVPYFLLPGNHTAVDIPLLVGEAEKRLKRPIAIAEYLGGRPAAVSGLAVALADIVSAPRPIGPQQA